MVRVFCPWTSEVSPISTTTSVRIRISPPRAVAETAVDGTGFSGVAKTLVIGRILSSEALLRPIHKTRTEQARKRGPRPMTSNRLRITVSLLALLVAGCSQTTVRPVKKELISNSTEGRSTILRVKLEKYENLAKDFPKVPRYQERLARLHFTMGDYNEAFRYLKRAKKLDPGNPRFDYFEGKIYLSLGNYSQAEAAFLALLENTGDQRFTGPYIELAQVCLLQERQKAAMGWLDKCLEIDPNYSTPHYYVGKVWYERGNKEKAIEHFELYLRLGGSDFQDEVLQALQVLQPNVRIHAIR
ncbi:MAG TPA: tetratricopeptide repeat protein [Planctomycetes bacterium]|nr:tetratricopeptide repeat protein [Planctomycetota bacterium]HIN80178.1 tetratricopeptide repeat protein [Planctomycetota bacterium]